MNNESQLAVQTETFVKPKVSALAVMATRLSMDANTLLKTLKDTVFKGASDSELAALTIVANEYGLNPFVKELYAFPAKGGGIVPVVSVDGWIALLNRQPTYDGIDFEFHDDSNGKPVSCMAVIHIKGRSRPVAVQEFFAECYRNTDPWNKAPRRMLRHKALIQCARVAFGFSGITDEDDARTSGQIDETKLESAKPVFSTQHKLPAPPVESTKPDQSTTAVRRTKPVEAAKPKPAPVEEPQVDPTPEPVQDEPLFDADQQAEPTAEQTPGPDPTEDPEEQTPLDIVRVNLEASRIDEAELVAWAKSKGMLFKGATSLLEMTVPRLNTVANDWQKISRQIIEGRGPQ